MYCPSDPAANPSLMSSVAVLSVVVVAASLVAYTMGALTVVIICVLCERCQIVLRKCNTSTTEASETTLHKEVDLNTEQIKLKENVVYGQLT